MSRDGRTPTLTADSRSMGLELEGENKEPVDSNIDATIILC